MSAEKNQEGVFDIIWDWLCSLKVNVIILIALAILSIAGTIIPQNEDPSIYLRFAGPTWYKIFQYTQLDDMYHSYWFVSLLGLLCVTITCCSIDKFPIVWRFVVKPKKDLDDTQLKTLSLKETLIVKTSLNEALQKYKDFLGKNVGAYSHSEIDGSHHLFAQKGLFTRFGVYVTHLSLLIIIIGALLGVAFGKKGFLPLLEFTSMDEFRSRSGEIVPLGFTLYLDSYETSYYPNSKQPKEFTSQITVIENDKEVMKKTVQVNHPLSYKGYTFYQSSYGSAAKYNPAYGDASYAILDVVRKSDGAVIASNRLLRSGTKARIPATPATVELVSYNETFKDGPMAGLSVTNEDGTSARFWSYSQHPEYEDNREGDYKFIIKKVKPLEYTGLQVTKDPGVATVYTGCFLMIIGSLIAFFTSHRRFWIRIDDDKGKVKVTLAATTNKNKETFERYFDMLKEKFKHA